MAGCRKREAAAVELHLADCERCTAMLATFVRTTPELPAAESLWRRWHLRWLVPMATASNRAALWVLIPDSSSRLSQTSDTTVATRETRDHRRQRHHRSSKRPRKRAANAGTQAAPAEQKRADAKALAPLERGATNRRETRCARNRRRRSLLRSLRLRLRLRPRLRANPIWPISELGTFSKNERPPLRQPPPRQLRRRRRLRHRVRTPLARRPNVRRRHERARCPRRRLADSRLCSRSCHPIG
jgi:hypothetical protein